MKPTTSMLAAALLGLITALNAGAQGSFNLNFASTPGSTIQFNGTNSSFQFNTSTKGIYTGSQWAIGSGGTDQAIGLLGSFNIGPFTYGSITTDVSGNQLALIKGQSSSFTITDDNNISLTGSISWVNVSTHNYLGGLNSALDMNITGLSYAGTNPDLLTLAANGNAALDLSFQFAPGMTLSDLTAGSGPYKTSYSGSIVVVPEPTTNAFILAGLAALACVRFARKNKIS